MLNLVHDDDATVTIKQKLDIARQLAKLDVNIIELDYPAAFKIDLEAVRLIVMEIQNMDGKGENDYMSIICGFAKCNEMDIDSALETAKFAKKI